MTHEWLRILKTTLDVQIDTTELNELDHDQVKVEMILFISSMIKDTLNIDKHNELLKVIVELEDIYTHYLYKGFIRENNLIERAQACARSATRKKDATLKKASMSVVRLMRQYDCAISNAILVFTDDKLPYQKKLSETLLKLL